MDFITGVFAGALAFPVVLAALSWWALIIVLIGIVATEAAFYPRKNDLNAFVILLGVFLFTAFVTTEAEGLWSSIFAVIQSTLFAMFDFVILGMIATIPLWLWEVRKFFVKLRDELTDFIKQKAQLTEKDRRYGEPLTAEDREICKRYKSGGEIPGFLKEPWKRYRDEYLSYYANGMKVADNLGTISSMIFLWPFHIITMIFGDFLAKIPEWFAHTFGRALDYLARMMRYGIPKDIDDK